MLGTSFGNLQIVHCCNTRPYKMAWDLVAPFKPEDKTFDKLKDVVLKHFKLKPSAILQRYKFNQTCNRLANGRMFCHRSAAHCAKVQFRGPAIQAADFLT